MDFLDPRKQRRYTQQLILGYILVFIAIMLSTAILVELAYGYGYDHGKIIQNGFVFFSSQPNPANLYINGKAQNATNTRIQLPDGTYQAKIQRDGYRTWQRAVSVQGGTVQHFDYPVLFPTQLITTPYKTLVANTALSTQSPDRRWLLVADANPLNGFNQYDLANPKQTSTSVLMPVTLLTKPAPTDKFTVVEWSTDNKHLLLLHAYDGGQEYILLDRTAPTASVNLTAQLKLNSTQTVSLRNKAFDQYFVLDTTSQSLGVTTIKDSVITPYIEHVLAFKSYGRDTVLYATPDGAQSGKVTINLWQSGSPFTLRQVSAAPPYLLDLTTYSGKLYVAAGASGDSRVYIYKNPTPVKISNQNKLLVSNAVLRTTQPDYISFSQNARFILVEKANAFALYDAETAKQYSYTSTLPLDNPQVHAQWMDGNHLMYVSGGKLNIFDYDYTNVQTLMTASPSDGVYFDPQYKFMYTLASAKVAPAENITSTSLLIPADQ